MLYVYLFKIFFVFAQLGLERQSCRARSEDNAQGMGEKGLAPAGSDLAGPGESPGEPESLPVGLV